jgi:hypothetical protein
MAEVGVMEPQFMRLSRDKLHIVEVGATKDPFVHPNSTCRISINTSNPLR